MAISARTLPGFCFYNVRFRPENGGRELMSIPRPRPNTHHQGRYESMKKKRAAQRVRQGPKYDRRAPERTPPGAISSGFTKWMYQTHAAQRTMHSQLAPKTSMRPIRSWNQTRQRNGIDPTLTHVLTANRSTEFANCRRYRLTNPHVSC